MNIYQQGQYEPLINCLLCYPVNLKIIENKSMQNNHIDKNLAVSQYNKFVNELSGNGIKINFIDTDDTLFNQVFVQDVGFVIEDILFISKMNDRCRENEIKYLKKYALEENIKYYEMKNNAEGGDIIHYDNIIFVGLSTRTTMAACEEIRDVLAKVNSTVGVIPIKFDCSKVHLDTVFNVLDKGNAVISPYVYDREKIESFIANLYDISKEDADEMGTNYVYLGNKKLISCNKKVSSMLQKYGYDAQYVDYSEISKAGGGLECSILFLLRKEVDEKQH